MMDGIQTMLKFLLIFFNFVIFVSIFIFSEIKFSTFQIFQIQIYRIYRSGSRSGCIRNRRLGDCRRPKVHRTLRQGKSLN